jgi:hypothetical protein
LFNKPQSKFSHPYCFVGDHLGDHFFPHFDHALASLGTSSLGTVMEINRRVAVCQHCTVSAKHRLR